MSSTSNIKALAFDYYGTIANKMALADEQIYQGYDPDACCGVKIETF